MGDFEIEGKKYHRSNYLVSTMKDEEGNILLEYNEKTGDITISHYANGFIIPYNFFIAMKKFIDD